MIQVEEFLKIERQYPSKKIEIQYPKRYDNTVFKKLEKMNADMELQNAYIKWKNGINYETNRKITVGGKIHENLRKKFVILSYEEVLFDTLNSIDINTYLSETERIHNEINIINDDIKQYNKLIDSIIDKIKKLKSWNEFIEFENKKYGLIDIIKDNIHIENDCFGEMILTYKETEYIMIDRPFCNYPDKEKTCSIYKCSTCSFEDKIVKYGSRS